MATELVLIPQALARCEAWITERDGMLAKATACTAVEDAAGLQAAGALLAGMRAHRRALEAERKAVTAPADAWKAEIMAQEKALAAILDVETARVKSLCDGYATREAARVEAIRQAEAAKARAAEEARAKAEAEERRKAAEAMAQANAQERARLAQAEAARQAEAAAKRAAEEAAARAAAALAPKAPATTANRIVTRWSLEIVEPAAVPRAFCSPDEQRIRRYMTACLESGETPELPGVRFVRTESVESRGNR